jgi:hypothetical protein
MDFVPGAVVMFWWWWRRISRMAAFSTRPVVAGSLDLPLFGAGGVTSSKSAFSSYRGQPGGGAGGGRMAVAASGGGTMEAVGSGCDFLFFSKALCREPKSPHVTPLP